jgi:hypothetical protein
MPMTLVRYLALLVFLLGGAMLILQLSNNEFVGGYNILRWLHIFIAVGLIGLYEASLARTKRLGIFLRVGRLYRQGGRITLTLALLIGFFLLLSLGFNWLTGAAFDTIIYIHALVGLAAVSLAALVFWRQQSPRQS